MRNLSTSYLGQIAVDDSWQTCISKVDTAQEQIPGQWYCRTGPEPAFPLGTTLGHKDQQCFASIGGV